MAKIKHGSYELYHMPNKNDDDKFTIYAYHDQHGDVGYANFLKNKQGSIEPDDNFGTNFGIYIDKDHRRKGLASKMYEFAENITGLKMKPSETQSELGEKMWASKKRKFGKSIFQKLQKYQDVHSERMSNLDDEATEVSSIAVINGGKLLMGIRNDTNLWTLPGGKLEDGDTPLEGAIRELFEEAGIREKELHYLESDDIIGYKGSPVRIHAYVCFGNYPTTSKYDPDHEVDRWQWIDVNNGLPEEIKNNLHSPKNVVLKAIGLIDF